MARVTLRPEIASISGKVGNMVFKTMKNGRVYVYKVPSYDRKRALSESEMASRELMAKRQKRVVELMRSGLSRKAAWSAAKQEIPQ